MKAQLSTLSTCFTPHDAIVAVQALAQKLWMLIVVDT